MDTLPNYPMFALLKNNYVIDAVFGGPDLYFSAIDTKKMYQNMDNNHATIKVTIENSPIQIGDYFDGNKFIKKINEGD